MRASLAVFAVAVIAVAVIAVAGCGGDDNGGGDTTAATTSTSTTGAATTPGAKATNVSLTDFKIDPANPRIDKAGPVSFSVKNDGGTVHSLEVEGPNGEAKLANSLDPGQTGTLTVDLSKPGKYEWYCPIDDHKGFGMEGEITVAGGGGTGTGTSTTETNTTETNTNEDSGGSGGYGGYGG
jgi:uncharacterized cupredoxin-like copper-binding protein